MSSRAAPPVLPAVPAPLRVPPVLHHQLDNGLRLLIVERRELPVVDAQLVVRGGPADDDPALAGRAALAADLLLEGTALRSSTDIADEAELLGASLYARAGWDACTTALHVLTPRLRPALALLADVVTRATMPDDEVLRKRTERLAAIMQELDDPRILASRAFADVIYGPHHPYGVPVGGTRESVERLEATQLRNFHADRFSPANSFLVIVGDVSADDAVSHAADAFGHWQPADRPAAALAPPVPTRARAIHIVDRPGAPQSELRVGHHGPPRSTSEYAALQVANSVLGGAFTSRLNMRLREEKGYTYGAGSSFAFRAGGGPFVASTAVHTAATADAVNDMVREIELLVSERVEEEELERARRYIVLGLPREFETTGDVAAHVMAAELHGLGDDFPARYAAAVSGVTAEAVQGAAERWLHPAQLSIVVAGDAAAVRGELEALGAGEVHVRNDG